MCVCVCVCFARYGSKVQEKGRINRELRWRGRGGEGDENEKGEGDRRKA